MPREDLLGALRLNSLQFTLSAALGPALAGAALAKFGPGFTFFVNAVSFLLVIAALLSVRGGARPPGLRVHPPIRAQVAEGLPHGRLEDHPELGHFGPLQHPAAMARSSSRHRSIG